MPKVGHGFSVPRNWMPQFKAEFQHLVANSEDKAPPSRAGLQDLPLVEVLASRPSRDVLAVILSGDGGWAGIDREIADVLAKKNVPVVGLNSLRYFWQSKTPKNAAADLERILKAYMALWNKDKVVLIGYSLGADVLPFMANRLPSELLSRLFPSILMGDTRLSLRDKSNRTPHQSVDLLRHGSKSFHIICSKRS